MESRNSWKRQALDDLPDRPLVSPEQSGDALSMKPGPQKYHRRSIRLPGYDYTAGAFFITLVTRGRECLFGKIRDGEMLLSPMGQIADANWRAIPAHFPGVELGEWVVMPNHVHGIILMTNDDRRGTIYRAPTEEFRKPVAGSIPTIIRAYKASVTRRIHRELNVDPVWQRNYFEHIIRNDTDHNRIHLYIQDNIDNWATDDENPAKAG